MDVAKAVLSSKNIMQAYKAINMDFTKERYPYESLIVGFLSAYALNKEKNKNKPKFEGLELMEIFNHLVSEIHEVRFELNNEKIDYERVLNEIADCSALLAGLIAYIMEHKDDSINESD